MSDFHPETWNPLWSVSSVITGLYTFWVPPPPRRRSATEPDQIPAVLWV